MKTKILISLLTLACLLAIPARAQVNYAVSGGSAYVTSSPNASGSIVIASTYQGKPVTRIGDFAFYVCSLTSVTITSSVTSIGNQAFSYCASLTSVTIPNSVTSIGNFAFYHCASLTSVTIPNSVTIIGDFAFSYCASLTTVTIPNSVTYIGQFAFSSCTSLTSVTIPNSVTSIGSLAFSYCTSLTNISVDAANSVYSSLGGVLFNKAQTSLIQFPGGRGGSYSIPNSVTNIGISAFEGCTSLTDVTIPNSVTSIGSSAFASCTSLTSVTIGSGVTTIGESAFGGCSSLRSVTFLGHAPSQGEAMFDNVDPGAMVYYYYGTTGWEPTYGGLPTVMLNAPAPPSLTIQRTTTNTVVVSWPSNATGFVLQQNTNGLNSVNWSNVTAGVQNDGTNKSLIASPTGLSRFYRLIHP